MTSLGNISINAFSQTILYQLHSIFTVRNEVAKVMSLHLCVCPQGGCGIRACTEADTPHPGTDTPWEQTPPSGANTPQEQTPPQQTATAADGTHPGFAWRYQRLLSFSKLLKFCLSLSELLAIIANRQT